MEERKFHFPVSLCDIFVILLWLKNSLSIGELANVPVLRGDGGLELVNLGHSRDFL